MLLDLYRQIQPRPVSVGRRVSFFDPFNLPDRAAGASSVTVKITVSGRPVATAASSAAAAKTPMASGRPVAARGGSTAAVPTAARTGRVVARGGSRARVTVMARSRRVERDLWLLLDDEAFYDGW